MEHKPYIKTKVGWGRLWRVEKNRVLVEFDYMYLVELKREDVDWSTVPNMTIGAFL